MQRGQADSLREAAFRRIAARRTRPAVQPGARRAARVAKLPVELQPFEGILDDAVLHAAAERAERLGVGGDEVLRCAGILTSDQIAVVMSARLGLSIDPLVQPFEPAALEAACTGVLYRRAGARTWITVAARGTGVRWLAQRVAEQPQARKRLRIASPERLSEHVRNVAAGELAREAVHGLRDRRRDLSAMAYGVSPLQGIALGGAIGAAAGFYLSPSTALVAAEYALATCFIVWTMLRLIACLFPRTKKAEIRLSDRELPLYTIIVPLYREAEVAGKLVAALKKLRYPREKLDIKLVLEQDDAETRAAVEALKLHAPFEIVAPPRAGPQTKPKALSAALPFARGSFVTIYDAEDEPDPNQLRDAVAAFVGGPPNLACVQARLAIDNSGDGWISRQFAAEYAGQFDVFLPALARLRLPLPLGGTSNHFRTAVLRKVGGWDPFNVTEDADLGMRLARFGYRTDVVDSTTWEEAPVGLLQWGRQRTRWFKGWAQTWIVHMRHPVRLWRELGTRGFLSLQLLIGGSLLSALVHPFFVLLLIHHALNGELFASAETVEQAVRKTLAFTVLAVGYFGSISLGFVGLRRRGMLNLAWILPTIPLYWLLLSAAAWRALWQLIRAPYKWEKTAHGLARTSLRAKRMIPPPQTRPVREFVASRPAPRL